ncbi:Junctional adhesion molecule B [Triplophysa tibetana]|uniref:Junctional adhesion molecule B n=1 Tax=Triplophysa tibetana TaxID=1572043 RepID=A0A5A9P4I7_9TELE|nr:Junctional adhesion molecule B [Triplophysa tibetana]
MPASDTVKAVSILLLQLTLSQVLNRGRPQLEPLRPRLLLSGLETAGGDVTSTSAKFLTIQTSPAASTNGSAEETPQDPISISVSVTVTTRKPKLEVHENTNSFKGRASIDGATVTLRGVTQKDTGVYQCEVTARHDKINLGEVIVTLSVLGTVVRGYSVEMHCKDKLSVPPATYSWYKDNKLLNTAPEINYSLDPKTGTLKFKSISKSDEGQYRCEASNGVGAPKSCAGRHMRITECK